MSGTSRNMLSNNMRKHIEHCVNVVNTKLSICSFKVLVNIKSKYSHEITQAIKYMCSSKFGAMKNKLGSVLLGKMVT